MAKNQQSTRLMFIQLTFIYIFINHHHFLCSQSSFSSFNKAHSSLTIKTAVTINNPSIFFLKKNNTHFTTKYLLSNTSTTRAFLNKNMSRSRCVLFLSMLLLTVPFSNLFIACAPHRIGFAHKETITNQAASANGTDQWCTNPSRGFLEDKLAKHREFFFKIEEEEFHNGRVIDYNKDVRPQDIANLVERSQCIVQQRTMPTVSQRSTCPWRYVTTWRNNKFPRVIAQAICTCDKCDGVSNHTALSTYNVGCRPVFVSRAVLDNVGCVRGINVWKESRELVSVSCTCAHREELVPIN